MKDISQTLWKFLEGGILSDENRHDAFVYFGRRISRAALVEQVHVWARVLRGMGLNEGDELMIFGPSLPEFVYIMLAADMTGVTANLPNLMAKPEALDAMAGKSRVAFVFDGLEQTIRHTIMREQFEHVVIISATRSMGYPLKLLASPLNSLKQIGLRFRNKYMTADAAIRRFGHYDGPLEVQAVPGRAAFLFCSSGTSNYGLANQISMSDEAMIAMCRNALVFNEKGAPFREGTTSYWHLPPFVCTGMFVEVVAPLYKGMTVYIDPRVEVNQFIKNILTFRPQIVLTPGGNWMYFIKHVDELIARGKRPDLSFFRFPVMGGEGCTPQALRHMNEVLEACGSPVALTSGYGLSETFSVCTVDYEPTGFDKDYSRPVVSVGAPFPGVTIGIFDEDGKELGSNQRGEIRVKTDAMTMGYVNNPELTQERLQDGWLHTHDLGELDSNGKLFVYGRMAQYIEANGEKVYLFDIANKLREDPAVKEALVCQLTAEGSPLVAHVVLEDGIQESERDVLCRLDRMMAAYLPSGLRIAGYRSESGHLRINIVGKIDRSYYHHLLSGYYEIHDGELRAVAYKMQ